MACYANIFYGKLFCIFHDAAFMTQLLQNKVQRSFLQTYDVIHTLF